LQVQFLAEVDSGGEIEFCEHNVQVEDPASAYVLAPHPSQIDTEVAPGSSENFPASQVEHASNDDAAVWSPYLPCGHSTHRSKDLAPAALPYFPVGQSLQFVMPSFSENLPCSQGKQLVEELLPAIFEYVPAPHDAQLFGVVAPRISEYFAAGHLVHASEVAPICSEYFPAVQSKHEASDDEAFALLNLPIGHRMHCELPRMALYLP